MKSIILRIPGRPFAMPRWKISGKCRWLPPREKGKLDAHRAIVKAEWGSRPIIPKNVPVFVKIRAVYNRPARLGETKTYKMRVGKDRYKYRKYDPNKRVRRNTTPDNDNLEKFVFDALQGVAIENDSQIWSNTTEKWYGRVNDVEHTTIEIGCNNPQD